MEDPFLRAIIFLALVWVVWSLRSRRPETIQKAGLFFGMLVAQVVLASVGWFDRYQAYLIILGAWFLVSEDGLALLVDPATFRQHAVGMALAVVAVLGLGHHKVGDLLSTPEATNNVYEQQYQMARFIAAYYPGASVAANDVGLLSDGTNRHITDLYGLGSTDILRVARAAGGQQYMLGAAVAPLLARAGAQVMVIYPDWFQPSLYANWFPVARWTIGGTRVTVAEPSVVFFAPTNQGAALLRQNLIAFQPQLPTDERVSYLKPVAGAPSSNAIR